MAHFVPHILLMHYLANTLLPDRYLTLAIRYSPSSNPGTLLVSGSNTAAQRLRSGGGG